MAGRPKVMVSSTFYDLKQIRADLLTFMRDDLGFEVLISESSSFPVEAHLDTVENCVRRVQDDADVLVLVVGSRYGSVESGTEKSITSLEYEAARAKGIPVIAFVQKSIGDLLRVYKDNPVANFSSAVDDPRLFDFIIRLREVDRVWVYDFDLAQDIINTLRTRFAHLMAEGLSIGKRLRASAGGVIHLLSGPALRYTLDRPLGWPYRLFAQVLRDEVAQHAELLREYELGIAVGRYDRVPRGGSEEWLATRCSELQGFIAALDVIDERELRRIFGSGDDIDIEHIVYSARSIVKLYEESLRWAIRLGMTSCDEVLVPIIEGMQRVLDDLIGKLGSLGNRVDEALQEMDEAVSRGEEPKRQIVLDFEVSGADSLLATIARVQATLEAEPRV